MSNAKRETSESGFVFCPPAFGCKLSAEGCRLSLLFSLLLAVSCSWVIKPVETRLTGLAWSPEQGLELIVAATNPNRFSARLSELDYTMFLEDIRLGAGRHPDEFELRPGVTVQLRLPFTPETAGLLLALPLAAADDALCRAEGTYRLSTPFGKPELKFRLEERLAVRERLGEAITGSNE